MILPLPSLPFAGSGLNRAASLRADGTRLAALANDSHSRFLPLAGDLTAFSGSPETPRLLALAPPAARRFFQQYAGDLPFPDPVFLGIHPDTPEENGSSPFHCRGYALFAFSLPAVPDPEAIPPWGFFADLRRLAGALPPTEAACAAHARALLHWHRRHGFCPVCGHPTFSQEGGHVRRCANPACAVPQFPRTDPAVIMLVETVQAETGAAVLLARQPGFPPGMYSVLAGFVEPGESLEEAVRREVWEETAVLCQDIRYAASQPWPFPASLMIGFTARAPNPVPPVPAAGEIEDARWCDRPTLARAIAGTDPGFWVPGPISLAHALLQNWLTRA